MGRRWNVIFDASKICWFGWPTPGRLQVSQSAAVPAPSPRLCTRWSTELGDLDTKMQTPGLKIHLSQQAHTCH